MLLWQLLLFVSMVFLVTLAAVTFLRSWRRRQEAKEPPRTKTVYRDIWTESAKRMPLETSSNVRQEIVPTGDPVVPGVRGDKADPNADTRSGPAIGRSQDRPVALITGGARRVGAAIAQRFAQAGCDVIITYRESKSEAEETIQNLKLHGVTAGAFRVDLGELEQLDQWAQQLCDNLPRLDFLVHNASIYQPSLPDPEIVASAMRHYRINTLGPLLLTCRLAPLLRQSTHPAGACVVAMADIHAMGRPRKGYAAYSMSKAALVEMIQALSRDFAPEIRVNGVAPGVVAWPEEGDESRESEQAKYLRRIPLGRAGTPEDAAEAVRWLCMDAGYVTGEILRVDGGRWLT